VSVTNLFGRLTYDLQVPVIDGRLSRLVLLHGDNGSGKTTLLGLIWNTLSAADNKGHRSSIAKIPFESLVISMSGETSVEVHKTDGLLGSFNITLRRPGLPESVVTYEVDDDLNVRLQSEPRLRYEDLEFDELVTLTAPSRGEKWSNRLLTSMSSRSGAHKAEAEYLKFLSDEVSNPLYLADDRSLWSDDEDIHRTREMISRRQEIERRPKDPLKRLVFVELQVTIRRVNEYLRSLTIGGQNDGSANSNSIYMNLLRQLATPSIEPPGGFSDKPSTAENLLHEISAEAPRFEEFGLVPKFDAEEFSLLLKSIDNSERRDLAERVISPFLSTMKARYEALYEAQQLLQALVPTINGFLREKTLTFTPREGLRILASDERPLTPESLSSGERQLLMLLCTTLLARLDSRLFIIDEPELSLGVEWQRKILDALLLLTENSSVQFIIATHSIEIISGHPRALVQLNNQ
jgi:energy-coupling factor transporter ATP-binding protein EcfA2